MKTRSLMVAISTLTIFLASGCATDTRTEREFGDAVRAVTTSQIHDLGAAQYPSKDAIAGGNSNRLEKVVTSHAENVGQANQVKTTLQPGASASQ